MIYLITVNFGSAITIQLYLTVADYEDLIESDDEEEYDDDDDIQYGNHGGSLPLQRSNDAERFNANKHLTVSNDDRPITPMRDKMVYNIGDSSLDFKDGL